MRRLGEPRITRCVSISYEFDSLCREHNISVSEACRVGIAILLGDKGIREYDNNLNLIRKMKSIQNNMQETIDNLNKEIESINARCAKQI
jgi:hypothetical protein